MKKKEFNNETVLHLRTNKQLVKDIDKIAISLTKRNKRQDNPFTRSDVIRRALKAYINSYNAK